MSEDELLDHGRKAIQILDGARSAFVDLGFDAASMDEIARRAQVSKPTLYSHFGDKRALFAAFVRRECSTTAAAIFEVDLATPGIAAALRTVGERVLDVLLDPFSMGIYRVIVAEAPRFPELGRSFYSCGIDLTARRLSVLLAAAVGRGELKVDDVDLAAHQFLQLCQVETVQRCLFDPDAAASKAQRRRIVETAVSMFTRAYRP